MTALPRPPRAEVEEAVVALVAAARTVEAYSLGYVTRGRDMSPSDALDAAVRRIYRMLGWPLDDAREEYRDA